jgi:adenylate cyclase, class 2
MKEIEAKILEVNRVKAEQVLTRMGAKKVFDGEIQTLLFDFQDGRISKEKNVLRLRQQRDRAELTYKKVQFLGGAKVADEYSAEVSDIKAVEKILENLGLSPIESLRKYRVSYELDGIRFDFDKYLGQYEFIPEFLEIEAENADLIHKQAALLGFQAKDCLPWSTDELIQHYASKNRN